MSAPRESGRDNLTPEERDAALARIATALDFAALAGVDMQSARCRRRRRRIVQ